MVYNYKDNSDLSLPPPSLVSASVYIYFIVILQIQVPPNMHFNSPLLSHN